MTNMTNVISNMSEGPDYDVPPTPAHPVNWQLHAQPYATPTSGESMDYLRHIIYGVNIATIFTYSLLPI